MMKDVLKPSVYIYFYRPLFKEPDTSELKYFFSIDEVFIEILEVLSRH